AGSAGESPGRSAPASCNRQLEQPWILASRSACAITAGSVGSAVGGASKVYIFRIRTPLTGQITTTARRAEPPGCRRSPAATHGLLHGVPFPPGPATTARLRRSTSATSIVAVPPTTRLDQIAISPVGQPVRHGDGQNATSVATPKATTSRL